MAGKHYNTIGIDIRLDIPPVYPGTRLDRAYTEGRQHAFQGGSFSNPHPGGSPEGNAWSAGFLDADSAFAQIQTCWAGTFP